MSDLRLDLIRGAHLRPTIAAASISPFATQFIKVKKYSQQHDHRSFRESVSPDHALHVLFLVVQGAAQRFLAALAQKSLHAEHPARRLLRR